MQKIGDIVCVQGGVIGHPLDTGVGNDDPNSTYLEDLRKDQELCAILFELLEDNEKGREIQDDDELMHQLYDNNDGHEIVFIDGAATDAVPPVSSKRKHEDDSCSSGQPQQKKILMYR